MSIKSDRWIRRMAAAHGMIEPFSGEQVRLAHGQKIVSYGTSSYGYDVRCADEFKIFTNINSTIVDPKNFDEKSFVDFKGPVCIIPPNSFALASTVEFFRIPRSVLTVCLGKCVTGDTRVVDAETGAYVPITEMRWGRSTLAWNGERLQRAKVAAFLPQGKREVFELCTRSGLRVRATANHPFLTLEKWTPLGELRAGDRIAVARDIPVFGKTPMPDWEASLLGLMISEGQSCTPNYSPTFASADPLVVELLKISVRASGFGEVIYDGLCGYRLVNRAERGAAAAHNRAHEWLKRLELDVGAAHKFVPQTIFTAPHHSARLFLQALFSGDGGVYGHGQSLFVAYHSSSRRLIEDVHHLLLRFGIFSLIGENIAQIGTPAFTAQINDADQVRRFAERVGFVEGSVKQRALADGVSALIAARSRGLDEYPNPSMPDSAVLAVALSTPEDLHSLISGPVWDTVQSIEPKGSAEVYDITVPGLHSFVANDLIVHNSTYARCFSGETRVALVDGTAPTLEQMTRRADKGERFWGYSIGRQGRLIVTQLDAPRFIGRDELIEIELDNGETIRATCDHQFMRRDGRMAQAHALRPGDSLMPLYRDLARGYERVYQPIDGLWYPAHRLTANRSVFRRPSHVMTEYRGPSPPLNHKIAAMRPVPGDHDVYCLSVPEAGNFALEAGVFVHNCGIIVNVTPLEPEWEGHVTLEFSNTTPLPAKIYANEGVAQMLFLESDEVCETSYKDRDGKYQGQRGVTLPKA